MHQVTIKESIGVESEQMLKNQKQTTAASKAVNEYEEGLKDRLVGIELEVDDAIDTATILLNRLLKVKRKLDAERSMLSKATYDMEMLLHAVTRDSHAHPLAIEKKYGNAFERHAKNLHHMERIKELSEDLFSEIKTLHSSYAAHSAGLSEVAKNVNIVSSE